MVVHVLSLLTHKSCGRDRHCGYQTVQCSVRRTHVNICPRMSCPRLDALLQLEEKLNDIDEFIQSELGFEPLAALGPLTAAEVNGLSSFLQTQELVNGRPNTPKNVNDNEATCPNSSIKAPEVETEVQIMDLKDVYNKKMKKTLEGLEYRLEDSEVTVVVQASEEITSVRAYTQRCSEAAIRTHDTLGPVELEVNTLQSDPRRQVVTVDLGSVYKTEDGHPVYWLEKADVMQRNKWELVIAVEFSSGLTGNVTSRPFRVTTKAGYKMRRNGDVVRGNCNVQRLFRKIACSSNHSKNDDDDCRGLAFRPNNGFKKEFPDDACSLSKEFKEFSLMAEDDSLTRPLLTDNSKSNLNSGFVYPAEGGIVLQPNSVLDRHRVARYYSHKERIHSAVEQPELPGLLKLVAKRSDLVSSRRKANGHKSAEEVIWWACGLCFFERRKKSTIKAHVIQRVCQKSIEIKKSRGKSGRRQMERHFSWDFGKERFDDYSWKASLSV